MQNNFPKKSFLISIIVFCVSLFLLIFLYHVIVKNNKEIQSKEQQWKNEGLRREEVRTLDSSIKAIANERIQLETHFAQSSDVVPFLNTLEGLALRVNSKANVSAVSITDDRTALSVGLNATGTFSNLYRFLTLLENSPYELDFISMDIKKGAVADSATTGKSTSTSQWTAIFKIKLLSFIQ